MGHISLPLKHALAHTHTHTLPTFHVLQIGILTVNLMEEQLGWLTPSLLSVVVVVFVVAVFVLSAFPQNIFHSFLSLAGQQTLLANPFF